VGKIEKLIAKLKSNPKDFKWKELKKILAHYGYLEIKRKGKSGGSRRKYINDRKDVISLHEPHPEKTIKPYVVKQIIEHLNV
jgi:predicted RNA binding protein YcfA (HicA-like mRNA interferase family)